MALNKLVKASGKNSVTLYFTLSLPYRLSNNFSVQTDGVAATNLNWTHFQNLEDLTLVQLTIIYINNLQGKNISIAYQSEPTRRLIEASSSII
jgi:hypothetical protein